MRVTQSSERTGKQLTLDFDAVMRENRVRLMDAMNQINQRYGRSSLKLASAEAHRTRKL